VVTIAAPSDPGHVVGLFQKDVATIREQGQVEVQLAGRPFRIAREFLDDVAEQRLLDRVATLRKALLIFHSPTDQIVGISNATEIFSAAKHPKSFVSLADADHLLGRRSDAAYVANVLAAWAERYLAGHMQPEAMADVGGDQVIVTETHRGLFQQSIQAGRHRLTADEPVSVGGRDSGPNPYDFLLAALGACTSMTVRLYAQRKSLPLDRVTVRLRHNKIHAEDCAACETKEGMLDRIERTIHFEGDLDSAQRAKLLEIADKCPVHRTLTSEVEIRTVEG
jgi:putative redox protein